MCYLKLSDISFLAFLYTFPCHFVIIHYSCFVHALFSLSFSLPSSHLTAVSSFLTFPSCQSFHSPQILHLTCLQSALMSLMHCATFTSMHLGFWVANAIALQTFIFVSLFISLHNTALSSPVTFGMVDVYGGFFILFIDMLLLHCFHSLY